MTPSGQTICLCMIVKNEAPVIRRCLDSVRAIVDHWLIVDTGSTDGTQAIVKAHVRDLPGELVERPWRDFAHNRSEALALARPHGDYSLIVDADDAFVVPPGFTMPTLDADSYVVDIQDASITYQRTQLVRNALPWRYVGVLHEFLTCDGANSGGHLPLVMRRNHDGARRRDPDTYRKDAAILEGALTTEKDPFLVSRYTFYLAQSYRDCGENEKARQHYLARAELGFWDEEVFVALLQAGRAMERLARPIEEALAAYERATASRPTRAEALHAASRLCRLKDRFAEGADLARRGLAVPKPQSALFLEDWIYDYGLLDELAVNGYWSGHYQESLDASLKLLDGRRCPEADRGRMRANAEFARRKLAEMAADEAARGPLKIAVYTIALNEAAHVDRWVASVTDADYRVVADTGSTDDTAARLTAAGVMVHRITVRPWRFDDARNACLALVPADADICISLDMDEFMMPGWRAAVETAWRVGTTRLFYSYARGFDAAGSPAKAFRRGKIHSRTGYRWKRIVHEDLQPTEPNERHVDTDTVLMGEAQDFSKDRSNYLPLLKLAHDEDPTDSQICFWYARDLMYAGQNEESADKYLTYLALPSSRWADERSEAMRYLARVRPAQRMDWLQKAIAETPYRRELWLDLAEHYHSNLDWANLFWATTNGLNNTRRTGSYLDDSYAWNYRLFDLGALACSHLDLLEQAVLLGDQALQFNPDDDRLSKNLGFYKRQLCEHRENGRVKSLVGVQLAHRRASPMLQFNIIRVVNQFVKGIFDDVTNTMELSLIDLGYGCSVSVNSARKAAINVVVGSTITFARDKALGFLSDAPYILYQLEPLDWRAGLLPSCSNYIDVLKNAKEIWEYSPKNLSFLESQGLGHKTRYLPPGFHRVLESFRPVETPDIDVLFIGYLTERRERILDELRAVGVNVVHLGNCYGIERAAWCARARIVLNVHQFDRLDNLETVRISYLLANRCFVISETSDHDPYAEGAIYASYDGLVGTCIEYLGPRAAERASVAERGYVEIRRIDFVAALRKLIDGFARLAAAGY